MAEKESVKFASSGKIRRILNEAAQIGVEKEDDRCYRFGAIGFRKDGVRVTARNGFPTFPNRHAHCETRLVNKLDSGAVIFLARILRNGDWANARPCSNCERVLRSRKVEKIIYTVAPDEYCVWMLN